jgi:hypothetical protein
MTGPTGPSWSAAGAPEIVVYPEALRSAAGKMYGLQDQVNGILAALSTNINSLGRPRGDDSYGNQFASGPSGYLASRDALTQGPSGALPATASWLQFFGDDMTSAAQGFQDAEDSADQYFDPAED